MKAKVERLRMGLAAGAVVLLLVLVGMLGYSRYRMGKNWLRRAVERSGASVVRETDGFTYSQTVQGRTLFTLHAAKAFQHEGGVWTLNNVVITVYGAQDGRADRIYGSEFEWDEAKGIARAVGQTEMDLEVSAASANAQRAVATPGQADADSVHVRTSGLVFLRKLGVAATTEPVEFRYGQMTCTATGAEFDSSPSELHLLANVHATGEMRGAPVTLDAARLDFVRDSNVASLMQPLLVSREGKARAATALLHLRGDGSVERAEASGGVALDSASRHITAQALEAAVSKENRPQNAHFSGGVKLVDDDRQRPAQGEARDVRLRFDSRGQPAEVAATGAAHLLARQLGANGVWLERDMRGETLDATFLSSARGSAQLQQVHAVGGASMRGDSPAGASATRAAELKVTNIAADDLLATFVPAGPKGVRPDTMHGQGHAVLRQTGPQSGERTSSADTLDVTFAATDAPGAAERVTVALATEDGHVMIRSRTPARPTAKSKQDEVATGNADHAAYDEAREKLTLTGGAHLASGGTALSAATVVLDQDSGDAEAQGSVVATLVAIGVQAPGPATTQATHLAANHAVLHRATEVAEFEGTQAKPARMWQDASQVEAGSIILDRQKQTLVARQGASGSTVHSVFATAPDAHHAGPKHADQAGASADVLRVESRELSYSEAQREAVFEGPVWMEGAAGDVRARHLNAFFAPPAGGAPKRVAGEAGLPAGSVERVVATGDVRVSQPGRQGTGEQLTYKAADASFVLTGTPAAPPRVVDAQQGSVTGASLLFRPGDSTIVVSGGTAAGEANHTRARIDTKVRQ